MAKICGYSTEDAVCDRPVLDGTLYCYFHNQVVRLNKVHDTDFEKVSAACVELGCDNLCALNSVRCADHTYINKYFEELKTTQSAGSAWYSAFNIGRMTLVGVLLVLAAPVFSTAFDIWPLTVTLFLTGLALLIGAAWRGLGS